MKVLFIHFITFAHIGFVCLLLLTRAAGQGNSLTPHGPAARASDQMMTYDESQRRVLVFGGTGQDQSYSDLWSWDGRTWTLLSEAGPAPRNSGVLVYDARRKRTVLFGGRTRQGNEIVMLKDTWEWDGTRWHLVNNDGPLPRLHAAAAFDRKRGVVVLFGPLFGARNMPRPLPSETWTWDGRRWTKIETGAPTDCIPLGMVFDETQQTILLIVTKLGDEAAGKPWGATELWEWTGTGWRQNRTPIPSLIPNQSNAVSAGARGGVLVFEASNAEGMTGTTWRWDGKTWQALNQAAPVAQRGGHVLAYDRARQRVVMFGGTILLNGGQQRQRIRDLWEWDGKEWRQIK